MTIQGPVEWVSGLFESQPKWTVEPSLDRVASLVKRHLSLSKEDEVNTTVTFFAEGGFNKLYAVECPRGSYIMRVALPVEPQYKTLSETTTMELVRFATSIPVPRVLAFDASRDNELGFEWILMERIRGKPLADAWLSMSWSAKEELMESIADCLAQLFRLRFDRIGNIFKSKDLKRIHSEPQKASLPVFRVVSTMKRLFQRLTGSITKMCRHCVSSRRHFGASKESTSADLVVDRIVSMQFFWEKRPTYDVPRGPFSTSRDWLEARLTMEMEDAMNAKLEDAEDVEFNEASKVIIQRLRAYLPKFFPPSEDEQEQFTLHHDDLSSHNILVDDAGKLAALVDWECVSVLPCWKACRLPSFLRSAEDYSKPSLRRYSKKDDGTVSDRYFGDLRDYEMTLLRPTFLSRMETVEPNWIKEYRKSEAKTDFEFVVQECNEGGYATKIIEWLNQLDAEGDTGAFPRFDSISIPMLAPLRPWGPGGSR